MSPLTLALRSTDSSVTNPQSSKGSRKVRNFQRRVTQLRERERWFTGGISRRRNIADGKAEADRKHIIRSRMENSRIKSRRVVGRRRKFEGRGGLAMEAAPRRHNITILRTATRGQGRTSPRQGSGVGAIPSCCDLAARPMTGWGFSGRVEGYRERRRDAGRLRAAPAPLWLSLSSPSLTLSLCLSRESSLLCLSFSDGCRWCRLVLLVLVVMLFVQVSPSFPEGLLRKHIAWDALQFYCLPFMYVSFITNFISNLNSLHFLHFN